MKRKGRLANRIRSRIVQPQAAAQGGSWKWLGWLMRHECLFALAGSAVFALLLMAARLSSAYASLQSFVSGFAIFWMLAVFVVMVIVTEDNRKYARSGGAIQMLCGAIAGAGIALVMSAPWYGVGLGLMAGAFVGLTGKHWVNGL